MKWILYELLNMCSTNEVMFGKKINWTADKTCDGSWTSCGFVAYGFATVSLQQQTEQQSLHYSWTNS